MSRKGCVMGASMIAFWILDGVGDGVDASLGRGCCID